MKANITLEKLNGNNQPRAFKIKASKVHGLHLAISGCSYNSTRATFTVVLTLSRHGAG